MADLLFVDSPVGTGYSYVEDQNLSVKTDEEAATDLTNFLKDLYNKCESLRMSPLYVASESYGGKYAVMLGLSLINMFRTGEMDLKLGGISLGDAWISQVDYVMSRGPLLRDVARFDSDDEDTSNRLAEEIKQQIDDGQFGDATNSMYTLQGMVNDNSTNVDFYNFLLDKKTDPLLALEPALAALMNGNIRHKLMIIPDSLRWGKGSESDNVFIAMLNDIMKPRINEGYSGVGYGNFLEIGPLDTDLNPRNSTWLKIADLLFVDSPIGTGYSYVEDQNLLVKTDEEAATNLTTLPKDLYDKSESLRMSLLYIASESYGGKYAVMLGLSLIKTVRTGELDLKFGGISLGDTGIFPVDYAMSWGPLLRVVARLDSHGEVTSNRLDEEIKQQIDDGQFRDATNSMYTLQDVVNVNSSNVDFYNFLLDKKTDPLLALETAFAALMNGNIRQKLMIIPDSVRWGEGSEPDNVTKAVLNDVMKPRINEVCS